MSWQGVEGHDEIVKRFGQSLQRRRLPSAFLFVGPPGVGKRTFALKLAQTLFCETRPEHEMDPCGACPGCAQTLAASHPDLELVSKPPDKSVIPVDVFIGDREHRNRQGLCHNISLTPFRGGRKVAIIDDADHLAAEGANCLLKTLEEPPPRSMIILIGTSEHKQLSTIRSRCQIVRFAPLPDEVAARLLLEHEVAASEGEAAALASMADGSLETAAEMSDEALRQFRLTLLKQLCKPGFDNVSFVKQAASFVDEAGKDAPPRRRRMRQLFRFAAEFYRQLMRYQSGQSPKGDETLRRAVQAAVKSWSSGVEGTMACLDRCLDAMLEVDANANQATLLECWLDDLSTASLHGRR